MLDVDVILNFWPTFNMPSPDTEMPSGRDVLRNGTRTTKNFVTNQISEIS